MSRILNRLGNQEYILFLKDDPEERDRRKYTKAQAEEPRDTIYSKLAIDILRLKTEDELKQN